MIGIAVAIIRFLQLMKMKKHQLMTDHCLDYDKISVLMEERVDLRYPGTGTYDQEFAHCISPPVTGKELIIYRLFLFFQKRVGRQCYL